LNQFATWLSTTLLSVYIQNNNAWAIPGIQSIHIVGIGLVMGAVLMISLRVLGLAGMDQTLGQTTRRFGPWLTGSLWLLLATGLLMVIGEPVRELMTVSFWTKMFLVAVGAVVAAIFQRTLRQHERHWEETLVHRGSVKLMAVATLLLWLCIIILGRLIAYDHLWGKWSPATKAQ
jgi:hypothetical protein